ALAAHVVGNAEARCGIGHLEEVLSGDVRARRENKTRGRRAPRIETHWNLIVDLRHANGIAVPDTLVVDAQAGGDREPVVRRPSVLDVPGQVLVEIRADSPRVAVIGCDAGVDEDYPIRYCV